MSLFPAYKSVRSDAALTVEGSDNSESFSWLQNASCPPDVELHQYQQKIISAATTIQTEESTSETIEDSFCRSPANCSYDDEQETFRSRKSQKRKSRSWSLDNDKKKQKKHRHSPSRTRDCSVKKHSKHKKSRKRHKNTNRKTDDSSNSKEDLFDVLNPLVLKSKSVFLDDLKGCVKPLLAFCVDTKGDTNNLAFNGTHFTQLVRYRVLKNRMLEFGHNRSGKKFTSKKNSRFFCKKARKILFSDGIPVRQLPNLPSIGNWDTSEYIPLAQTVKEEAAIRSTFNASQEGNPLGIYDSKTSQYISGIGGPTELSLAPSQGAESDYWHRRLREFNQRLGANETDVALWLEFVAFQDQAFWHLFVFSSSDKKNESKSGSENSKLNRRALVERKLAILDRAIGQNAYDLRLRIARLEVGEEVWETQRLQREWETLLVTFPNQMESWAQRLVFSQMHFPSFSLSDVAKSFRECCRKLTQMGAPGRTYVSHTPPPQLGRCQVDVAFQLALTWQCGGYTERAVALLQALVELNCFLPDDISGSKMPLNERLARMEPFWDSRAPRFGEKESLGWATVMERKQPVVFPEIIHGGTEDAEDVILAQGGTTAQLWLAIERCRERHHWLPWDQDPDECEDVERMVSFGVVKGHLFLLEEEDDRFYLVGRFLAFLGAQEQEEWREGVEWRAVFAALRLQTFNDHNLWGFENAVCSEEGLEETFELSPIGPSLFEKEENYFSLACQIIEASMELFTSLERRVCLCNCLLQMMRRRFKALVRGQVSHNSLQKEFRRRAKNLLRQEELRNCLSVYVEYALLEEAMGGYAEAERVYEMTLGITKCVNLDLLNDECQSLLSIYVAYFRFLVAQAIRSGQCRYLNAILNAVVSLVLNGKFTASSETCSGATILKSFKKMGEILERHLTADTFAFHKEILCVHALVFILALLQLLTVGVKAASIVMENYISKVQLNMAKSDCLSNEIGDNLKLIAKSNTNCGRNSCVNNLNRLLLEKFYEDYIWLMEITPALPETAVVSEPISPADWKSVLRQAVRVADWNNKFLHLLYRDQAWHDFLLCLSSDGEISSIFAVVFRLLPHIHRTIRVVRSVEDGVVGCGHALEHLLDQAVSSSPGQHCPLLWRLYLALLSVIRPVALKGLIYRAITHCPGVKSVYLDCVHLVPSMLPEIINLMNEKGLRVRLPLEELQVLTEAEGDELLGEHPDDHVISTLVVE